MTKYIVRAATAISTEVEANTPIDAKIEALEDETFQTQFHNPEFDVEVHEKGTEPKYLRLSSEVVETLTGILGYSLVGIGEPDEEVQKIYEELVEFLEGEKSSAKK